MWWMPLIQSAVGLSQSISSGIKAGQDRKEADALQTQRETDNENQFNKEYYTDYTQRADSQNLLKKLKETTDTNNKRNEMTAAITGATAESVQAGRNANNKVVSDTYGNLAAMGARYKDNVMQNYQHRKDGLGREKYNALLQRAQSNETGMYNGIGQIGAGITGAMTNYQAGQAPQPKLQPLKTPQTGVTVQGGLDAADIKFPKTW